MRKKKVTAVLVSMMLMAAVFGCQKSGNEQTGTQENKTEITTESTSENTSEMTTESQSTEEASSEDQQENTTEQKDSDTGDADSAQNTDDTDKQQGDTDITDAATDENAWYGSYRILNYFMSPVSAVSNEEADKMLDAVCTFSAEECSIGDEKVEQPVYAVSTVTAEEFENDYNGKLRFADINVANDSMPMVTVENGIGLLGQFYIKGDNMIILMSDGVFYTAVKE